MMKSAPVFFTVAQVRFNPILSLDSYITAIQEHFRRNGFPDFKKVVMMTFNLSPLVQEQRNEAQAPDSGNIAWGERVLEAIVETGAGRRFWADAECGCPSCNHHNDTDHNHCFDHSGGAA